MNRDFNWCATEIDLTGKMTHWGLCNSDIEECPAIDDCKDLGVCIGDQELCEKLCSGKHQSMETILQ